MSHTLNFPDLLRKKRDGAELTDEEINWFIQEVVKKTAEESQVGAMLMAMYLKGLSDQETMSLTKAMVHSGDQLKWKSEWTDLLVDKHSTGGCGDKVSLPLAPALAACGFKVPMLSGRGLGYTGGTLDKLESIPGFNVQLSEEEMQKALEEVGCFIAGPTLSLAPGDRELYKLRDVTATVDSIPLIAGSIISKKVAEGTKALIMDVKVGAGALYKTTDSARELATKLMSVSNGLGVQTHAVLTKMDNPIGRTIGNALEVAESVDCLRGKGSSDLVELVTTIGAMVLKMKGKVTSWDEGKELVLETLNSGRALEIFKSMLIYQGVAADVANTLCYGDMWVVLPSVNINNISLIRAPVSGFLKYLNAEIIAKVVWKLGAGRSKPGQSIDHRVGIRLLHIVGDSVTKNETILEVHHSTSVLDESIQQELREAITITEGPVHIESLIIEVLTG